ncbi:MULTISPECIES: sacsin N-terminal ATP-binding-like domain-containing protein [Arthrobacter]|uniref:Sacsin/Nov domain-containing protein n=1 Tax=Arthrobacter terricola TaxID=2547396 RepID=A0A4V2ZSD8_9MICC|nr:MULTISPECIES: hypothetical protein [Arthrobacter]MBT8162556.1 hypothetical protein [Arthrobacter sp. GN70]TDF92884.1 hypothetical protein E1809_17150 [Arthrobacter terricola]
MNPEFTFESIAANGRAIVEAHKKKKGFEEGIRRLLSELYPDNAHFIYELLQNAEDAKATIVEFELDGSCLEVRHDGSRAFSLKDIDSITNIGDSTKKDDPTQIGKFGVGFKAVYSYTSRPEIRSGTYSFAIEDLFVNERITGEALAGWTSFRFPFNRPEKPAGVAVAEVARGLAELDEKTLLFLSHIRTVTYALPDGTVGIIERQELDDDVIKIQKSEGQDFVESHWLRLVGPTNVEHNSYAPLSVAAAFRLELGEPGKLKRGKQKDGEPSKSARPWSIVPLDHGDVSIYFPAVKETSGLRFHIHAPFASTVARDSVRDDPDNVRLVEDIGALIVGALPRLCSQGLINDAFLESLPNHDDPVGRPYNLIRDAIIDAFNELEITPARLSGYAPARSLVASPSEFRNGLAEDDLPFLCWMADIKTEKTPRWIRDRDGRAGKFLGGLDSIEFSWPQLGAVLREAREPFDHDDSEWLEWLAVKSDDAITGLYQLLGRAPFFQQLSWSLESIPLIRTARRGRSEHVKGPDTYLPSDRNDKVLNRVRAELAYFDDDEGPRAADLKAFYKAAGVRRWDESARIEARLDPYKVPGRPVPDGDMTKHVSDVRAFVRYALAHPEAARRLFRNVSFLLSLRPDGSEALISPGESYLDLPYRATGFSSLYPWVHLYQPTGQPVHYRQPYPVAGYYLDINGFEDFLKLAGSIVSIEITHGDVLRNPLLRQEWWVKNRHSAYTEKVDWEIKDLDKIIRSGDHDLMHTLWRTVVQAPAEKAGALYRANNSSHRYTFASQLAQELTAEAWVLDRNGDLRLPREVTADDLPDDWERPNAGSLVHKLEFGADAAQRRQKADGVSDFLRDEGLEDDGIDVLREAKDAGLTTSELRTLIREHTTPRRFPESASADPKRRSALASQDAIVAPEYRTESRLRSVVDGQSQAVAESRGYLRGQYTADDGEMFCQACHKPLPFKVDGQWYFESVRFVDARKQMHTANAVALCPLCAALYKYTRETRNDAILETLANLEVAEGQGNVEIPLILNGNQVKVRFTGKHAIDLRSALVTAGEGRS